MMSTLTLLYVTAIILFGSQAADLSILRDTHDNYHVLVQMHSFSKSFDHGIILINAKYLYNLTDVSGDILIENIDPNNRYIVAVYLCKDKYIELDSANTIDVNHNTAKKQKRLPHSHHTINFISDRISATAPRLSTYYTTIQLMEAQTWQNISFDMKAMGMSNTIPPNFETSIRSASSTSIYDLLSQWYWTQQASKTNSSIKPVGSGVSYYHERPSQFGYYCVYYKRDNEVAGPVPDCPNVTNILTEHAAMLESSGIDFIALDDTNLDGNDWYSDVMQLRPAEIMFETWNNLRKNGSNTPQITTWNRASGVQWQSYLDLYAQYPDMVLTFNDGGTDKKVFFVPLPGLDQSVVAKIENDGGKNDVFVQMMWGGGGMDENLILNGYWTFFYPCRVSINGKWVQTISMETYTECNFVMSRQSPLGTQISASMSWQNNYGSLPFGAPSKLNGRTFQLIIKDALSMKPTDVLFPSFNEHSAMGFDGSNKAAFGGNNTWGVGLYADAQRTTMGFFVDTYGSERSRGIEASDESGDYYYRLMQSCARVLRLSYIGNMTLNINVGVGDDTRICSVSNEICCNPLQNYVDVWSMYNARNGDHMVSNNPVEVAQAEKEGYSEICSPSVYSDTTIFCRGSNQDTFDAHRGPFIVYADGTAPADGSYADTKIARSPLYRCLTGDGGHFIAKNDNCDAIANSKMEYLIGYAAVAPSTAMTRRLVRCQSASNKLYYHVVDDTCLPQDTASNVLGYVFG